MNYWKYLNREYPKLIFKTEEVNDVNACKDQEKLKHENLQFSQSKNLKKKSLKGWE